ncbi:MAG TPA: galactokinase, partial [Chthonomonadales bacterium]|nr:galactokinase [Chthonomonadales bacterium]
TVPLGAGLSSSAALLVSAGLAFAAGAGSQVEPVKLALLAQKAEREYVGVNVGIMDQYISALGVCDHALLIDTRNLSHQAVPLPAEGVSIVILDTQKKRGLVDSEYNRRREECQEAVELISRKLPRVKALRDVSLADFAEVEASLPDVVRRRARHVVTEDARTLDAADALRREDLHRFGELMYASHRSLRDDYQVSCMELDALVEAACKIDGVYGCRMTGGGFGGCAVALARNSALGEIQESAPREYREKTGLSPAIYVTSASAGACLLRQAQTTVSA